MGVGQAHVGTHRHTHNFLVGVLSWIIGWKSIHWDRPALPVALAAMVNKEAHKHERQGDDHPDLSFALRGDQLKGWLRFFESRLYVVLIHSECITCSCWR